MDDKNVCEGLSQMKMNNKRQNSRNGNESHHLLQQGVPYIIYCQGAADMNHSIKLCHGCYNLHFDDDDNDDDDDHDNMDHLDNHEDDNYEEEDDDSIKISQSSRDLHFDGRSVPGGAGGPSLLPFPRFFFRKIQKIELLSSS